MTTPESPENATQSLPTETASEKATRHRGKLERAWVRRRLIIELAKEEKTRLQLSKDFGVASSSVTEFAQRHVEEIEAARQNLEDEFNGLWIAQKLDRLAEQQGLYEDSGISARDRETRLAVLRAAAEELGQIPNRTTVDFAQPVEVVIHGSDDV